MADSSKPTPAPTLEELQANISRVKKRQSTPYNLTVGREDPPAQYTPELLENILGSIGSAFMPEQSPFRHGTDYRKACLLYTSPSPRDRG